jgi:hypothetical protein
MSSKITVVSPVADGPQKQTALRLATAPATEAPSKKPVALPKMEEDSD